MTRLAVKCGEESCKTSVLTYFSCVCVQEEKDLKRVCGCDDRGENFMQEKDCKSKGHVSHAVSDIAHERSEENLRGVRCVHGVPSYTEETDSDDESLVYTGKAKKSYRSDEIGGETVHLRNIGVSFFREFSGCNHTSKVEIQSNPFNKEDKNFYNSSKSMRSDVLEKYQGELVCSVTT